MDRVQPLLAHRVAKGFLLALLILAVLETIARVGYQETAEERLSFGYGKDVGFVVDGETVELRQAASRSFWPQDFPLSKPGHTLRIMVVGDSVLRGDSEDESVSGRLRRLLTSCGMHAEVWNLASPGYGSQRKEVIVEKALEFEPDLLIYHANFTTEYEDERERERKILHDSWHPSLWPERLPFIGRVKLAKTEKVFWKWLPEEVREDGGKHIDPDSVTLIKGDATYWMPRMMARLRATVAEIRRAGIPILLLSRADLSPDKSSLSDHGLDQQLREFSRDPGVRLLSTRAVFERFRSYPALFKDGSHWRPEGHVVIARAMLPVVIDLLAAKVNRCGPGSTPLRITRG